MSEGELETDVTYVPYVLPTRFLCTTHTSGAVCRMVDGGFMPKLPPWIIMSFGVFASPLQGQP